MTIEACHLKKEFVRPVKKRVAGKKSFLHSQRTKESFLAVKDMSFCAAEGEILGILGPNGAGKTTLLRMLGNLMAPLEGEVRLLDGDGNVITDEVLKKKSIGYLSNNTSLYGRLSAREMFMLFGELYDIPKEECEKRAEHVFKLLEMEDFCNQRIEKLSTGQRQRASISRCLIHDPGIYIFDEPTLGLDILSSETIIRFMKEEKKNGKTVLYSTHYMEEAQYLCDRILMMNNGEKIAFGTPAELMEKTATDNLRDAFKAIMNAAGEVQSEI